MSLVFDRGSTEFLYCIWQQYLFWFLPSKMLLLPPIPLRVFACSFYKAPATDPTWYPMFLICWPFPWPESNEQVGKAWLVGWCSSCTLLCSLTSQELLHLSAPLFLWNAGITTYSTGDCEKFPPGHLCRDPGRFQARDRPRSAVQRGERTARCVWRGWEWGASRLSGQRE